MQYRLNGIESLRSYAAGAIVLAHLAAFGGVALPLSLNFVSSHFGLGVQLFFVVSGFSLSFGYFGSLHDKNELTIYYIRRFARIAPLFYTILIFQILINQLSGVENSNFDVFINAVFLFNLIPGMSDGIVSASWTIGVEMLFYFIFPILLLICSNIGRTIIILVITSLLAGRFIYLISLSSQPIYGFTNHYFLIQLPYFIWGMLAFHTFSAIRKLEFIYLNRYLSWSLILVSAFIMLAILNGLLTKTIWGLPFALLCVAMALHSTRILSNPLTIYIGRVSFSIYLLHPILLYRLGQAGFYVKICNIFYFSPVLGFIVSFLVSLFLLVGLSSLTFALIERKGMDFGKKLAKRWA